MMVAVPHVTASQCLSYRVVPCVLVRVTSIWLSRCWSIVEDDIESGMMQIVWRSFIHIICMAYTYLHVSDTTVDVFHSVRMQSAGKCIFNKITSFAPQSNMCLPPQQVLAVTVAS
jgi:hypothetical protein